MSRGHLLRPRAWGHGMSIYERLHAGEGAIPAALADTKLMKLSTYVRCLQPSRDYARRCVLFARAAAQEEFRSESMAYSTDLPGEVIACSLEGLALRPATGTQDLRSARTPTYRLDEGSRSRRDRGPRGAS